VKGGESFTKYILSKIKRGKVTAKGHEALLVFTSAERRLVLNKKGTAKNGETQKQGLSWRNRSSCLEQREHWPGRGLFGSERY